MNFILCENFMCDHCQHLGSGNNQLKGRAEEMMMTVTATVMKTAMVPCYGGSGGNVGGGGGTQQQQ
jgi:hypothetical protein